MDILFVVISGVYVFDLSRRKRGSSKSATANIFSFREKSQVLYERLWHRFG